MLGFGSMLKDYLSYYKISQTDFADRLDITTKHLNEILNQNIDISNDLMLAISLITDIDVNLILQVENQKKINNYLYNKFNNELEIKQYLNSFSLEEMNEKNWIKLHEKESNVQNAIDLLNYLNIRNFDIFDKYINKRILFKKSNSADMKKIYLWITRCDNKIQNIDIPIYKSTHIKPLLNELKIERNNKFNAERLVNIFNKYGIYLVIEDALKGTKIRGCMMVKGNNPAIYMTKLLKEKSSFYYALYHEIAHIKSDYNRAKNKIIINDEDELEQKRDEFALNEMIPNEVWKEILDNYSNKDTICKKYDIPLCFLYGRLAMLDKISYSSKDYNEHKEIIE